MKFANTHTEYQEEDIALLQDMMDDHQLVVWNDDVNTFDYVIQCLINICEHDPLQAEQCTMLIHFKGKCTVKTGSMEKLLPMHKRLLDCSLTSEIV